MVSSPKPRDQCLGRGRRHVWRLHERAQARQMTAKFLTPSVVSSFHASSAASVIMAVGLTFVQMCLWPGDLTSGRGDNLLTSCPFVLVSWCCLETACCMPIPLSPVPAVVCSVGHQLLFSLCERILDKNPLQGGKDYLTLWFEGIIHHGTERPGLGA